jgi:hypothetical protein
LHPSGDRRRSFRDRAQENVEPFLRAIVGAVAAGVADVADPVIDGPDKWADKGAVSAPAPLLWSSLRDRRLVVGSGLVSSIPVFRLVQDYSQRA